MRTRNNSSRNRFPRENHVKNPFLYCIFTTAFNDANSSFADFTPNLVFTTLKAEIFWFDKSGFEMYIVVIFETETYGLWLSGLRQTHKSRFCKGSSR